MCEKKFWLIQRGKINKEGGPNLTGREGVISLDCMGSTEFEWGAIPFSFRKIMHDFEEYGLFDSEVKVVGNRKLLLFCKKDEKDKIASALRYFVQNPYRLKEWSNLEKLIQVADISKPWTICRTRFWWCIDKGEYGQWMAFLEEDAERIYEAIKYDYHNWWLTKTEKERAALYNEAMKSVF